MFQNFKDFLLDRGSVASPAEKIRAFLFDELDSLYKAPQYTETILPILTTPYHWDDGHPLGLGNSEIIKNILEHLPTQQVIQFRRINSVWNNTACEILRTSLGHCKLRPSKLKLFLKTMKKSWCNPFSSYAIRIERLDDPLTTKFLRRFPPYIVRLRVKITSAHIPEFFQILLKMPLLEELHLIRIPEGCQSLRLEYVPGNSNAWKYGLYTFINLKSITLQSDDPSVPFSVNYDTCIVNLINSAVNLIHLKFIDWESPLAQIFARRGLLNPKSLNGNIQTSSEVSSFLRSDIEELFYRELKFKALKFTIDANITFNLILGGIIKSKTFDTLYHLSLKNHNPLEVFHTPISFPALINLGLRCWEGPVNFHSIRKHFPSLQTLKLHRNSLLLNENLSQRGNGSMCSICTSSNNSQEEAELPLIKSVGTLIIMPECALDAEPIDAERIATASKLFPNIKQLFIQAETNETLLEVYKTMPQLELLCVDLRGDSIGDEAFTGTPKDVVELKGWHQCECPEYFLPEDFVAPKENIGALKNLTTLIVKAGPTITNMSLVEGIVQLERLETLWLLPAHDRHEGDKATVWCLGAIADKLKNLKRLVISEEVSYSENDLLYLKSKLPKLSYETCQ